MSCCNDFMSSAISVCSCDNLAATSPRAYMSVGPLPEFTKATICCAVYDTITNPPSTSPPPTRLPSAPADTDHPDQASARPNPYSPTLLRRRGHPQPPCTYLWSGGLLPTRKALDTPQHSGWV